MSITASIWSIADDMLHYNYGDTKHRYILPIGDGGVVKLAPYSPFLSNPYSVCSVRTANSK